MEGAMDSGWVAAIASTASAFIVAATALAAFLQLRHYRNANDIAVYLRVIDQMDSPEMMQARRRAATATSDPDYQRRLSNPAAHPDESTDLGPLLRFLEHLSVLVVKGGVAESLILAEYAEVFSGLWDLLRPGIIARREAFGPYTGRAFEHLAMRSRRYIESGAMQREYDALERDTRSYPTLSTDQGE
jgi:hypothetical protein